MNLCMQAPHACDGAPGSILILPAGMTQQGKGAAQDHAAHAFKRGSWASPAFYLPAVKASNTLAAVIQ